MREIKFRAWDKDAKEMLTWEELLHADWSAVHSILTEESFIPLQYTGLQDKNGKEIYEGDIIACKFHPEFHERIDWSQVDIVATVKWDLCGFGLDAINGDGDRRYPQLHDLCVQESEVIGSIYNK